MFLGTLTRIPGSVTNGMSLNVTFQARPPHCRLSQLTPCQETAIDFSGYSKSIGCNREGRD